MNINLSAKKFDLTNSIQEHVEEKISALSRFHDNIIQAKVVLEVDDGHHKHGKINGCMIDLHVGGLKKDIIAEEWKEDMYLSVNTAVSWVEKELKKLKEKQTTKNNLELRSLKGEFRLEEAFE